MRSTEPSDFQDIARPVAVMAKQFAPNQATGRHSHARGQLLYAISGLMVATTERGAWAVPTGHALLLPPGLEHDVAMHGEVAMRTAYIAPIACWPANDLACRVIVVSALLDATLRAMADEPIEYDQDGRGAHLAWLILDEIGKAAPAPLALPLPIDSRLRRLCRALIDDPALPLGIDEWAQEVGVSRRTLTRRFREETGLSFGAWRRRVRLMHMLKQQADGKALKEAAGRVGYRSPQALRTMMRRVQAAGSP